MAQDIFTPLFSATKAGAFVEAMDAASHSAARDRHPPEAGTSLVRGAFGSIAAVLAISVLVGLAL